MSAQQFVRYLGIALAAVALGCTWLWQPGRQIQRHTRQFLHAAERGKIPQMNALMAEEYADRWGHDKEAILGGWREVSGQFVFLKIENRVASPVVAGRTGHAAAQLKFNGSGSPIAQLVMAKVNGLAEPFTFTWVRRSGKPWDWQLISADHPTLEPGEAMF